MAYLALARDQESTSGDMPSNCVSMGYVMPPSVPTNRQSQYGGRQHTVMVLALGGGREGERKGGREREEERNGWRERGGGGREGGREKRGKGLFESVSERHAAVLDRC